MSDAPSKAGNGMFRSILIICLLMFGAGAQAETRDVHKFFFDQKLGDFKADLVTAKQEGKKGILVMYEQEDCPWCARMKSTILNQSEVQDYFKKHFFIFPVDIKGDVTLTDFQGRETTEKKFSELNRVRATPVFAFFDLDGKMIFRFTGVAKDVNEFQLIGRYIVEGAYKTQTFPAYKQGAK